VIFIGVYIKSEGCKVILDKAKGVIVKN